MALFQYRALSSVGKSFGSVIDADSLFSAKERLRKQKILVVDIWALEQKLQELHLSPDVLLSFTRELSQLLKAGLPLYESLVTIEEKYQRHPAHSLFLDLCDHLKGGSSFSLVLKKYPKSFDQIYLSMVQAGEHSGHLANAVDRLYQLIFRQQKLKKEILSALTYPAFLGCFCFLIICGLLFFVIPSMQELFEGRSLHPLTHCILAVSLWANEHLLFLILSILSLITSLWVFMQKKSTRCLLEQLSLKIPFVKTLILDSSFSRFFRVTALLIHGGLPLVEALRLSLNVLKNIQLEELVKGSIEKIIEGERLTTALKHHALIPPLVIRMLSISEETGKMGDAFHHLAEIYEELVEKHLAQLSTFLQPALLIILGAIVGLVVLSILLPLTDVGSFLEN